MVGKDVMEPVRVYGRNMADSWWGKAWNRNLESYSDYSNRLPRGRSYLRNGSVIDLRITEGMVRAKVRGSRSTPYSVDVRISPMSGQRKEETAKQCIGKVSNLEALVEGDFPKELGEFFLSQKGLFPRPSEISFSCTCPDSAHMCKHIAAVLYGIGARFDQDPTLFFSLRGVGIESLIGMTAQAKMEAMMRNADRPSPRILDEGRVAELFGIGFGTVSEEEVAELMHTEGPVPEVPGDIMWKTESAVKGCLGLDGDDPEPRIRSILEDLLSSVPEQARPDALRDMACELDRVYRLCLGRPCRELDYLVGWMLRCSADGVPDEAFLDPSERNYGRN